MPLRGRQRKRLSAIVVVPDYQSLMLPMLRLASDQQVHELRDATNLLAKEFKLVSEDREQLLPSGRQSVFDNRVGWARTYMAKAGLLESAGRAKFRITERGLQTLKQNPARIDVKFLRQFPEFVAFQSQKRDKGRPTFTGSGEGTETPEERLEAAHSESRVLRRRRRDVVHRKNRIAFREASLDRFRVSGFWPDSHQRRRRRCDYEEECQPPLCRRHAHRK